MGLLVLLSNTTTNGNVLYLYHAQNMKEYFFHVNMYTPARTHENISVGENEYRIGVKIPHFDISVGK